MVALTVFANARAGALALAATVGFIANPAFANSSANADIAAPLRAAQAAKQSALSGGDEEFRQLFASWRSLDQGQKFVSGTAVPSTFGAAKVSIPSAMPVEGLRLTSGFGMRWHPVLGGHRQHKGVDLASPIGTPIHAAADGVVGRADWFSGYGLYIAIEHGGELETRYGHMSRLNVAAGQFVHKGDVIGYVGMTGRTTGPHLHYEVRVAGQAVNPIPYLEGTGTGQAEAVQFADAGDGEE